MNLLKKLFWSSRPVSWINTAYPFAAAYFFVTRHIDLTFFIGTIFFLIPYNLLMYGINDVFDYESDLRNPRKGGIEGALLEPKLHRPVLLWSFLLPVPFAIYLYSVGSSNANQTLTVVLFTVIAYSAKGLRFKEKPFIDSLTSSTHFVGPMAYALELTGVGINSPSVALLLVSFLLWGVASHAFGAVQDVIADREAKISSIATVIGARATTRFAFACYLAAGVLLLFAGWPASLVSIAAVPYLAIVAPFWNITDASCETANRGWKKFMALNFFAGFVVTLVLIFAIL